MAKRDDKKKDQIKEEEAKRIAKQQAVEKEKLEILAKASNVKGEQLSITGSGEVESKNELRTFALGSIEDPEKKFEIYYKGIQKLLKAQLPKGKENKTARDYIYEEKNTYLTRGKRINRAGIRGADGRMGYIADAEEMMAVIMDWIMSNATMVDLYNNLRELNISKGYGVRSF
ncbi:MAG: hypothetical protein H7069_08985 [Phormidesmis sp. FL-bin-119]|nr:hypothetical protein [Pedobacter sp.]